MSAPDLSDGNLEDWEKWLRADGGPECCLSKEDELELAGIIKELRERRKVRHPDNIKKELSTLHEKDGNMPMIRDAWRACLQWVLSPDKEEEQ